MESRRELSEQDHVYVTSLRTSGNGSHKGPSASKLSDCKLPSTLKDSQPQPLSLFSPESKEAWRVIAVEAAHRVNGLSFFDEPPASKVHNISNHPVTGMITS